MQSQIVNTPYMKRWVGERHMERSLGLSNAQSYSLGQGLPSFYHGSGSKQLLAFVIPVGLWLEDIGTVSLCLLEVLIQIVAWQQSNLPQPDMLCATELVLP